MSTVPATTEHVCALAAIRDGELTPEQCECMVTLLHSLQRPATTLAPALIRSTAMLRHAGLLDSSMSLLSRTLAFWDDTCCSKGASLNLAGNHQSHVGDGVCD